MEYIKEFDSDNLIEKFVYFKKAEKEAKDLVKSIEKEVVNQVAENGGFYEAANGKAQRIEKTNKKPLESLLPFLSGKGILEICRKDDIDLKKVEDLVDAGVITQEEFNNHVKVSKTAYIKTI